MEDHQHDCKGELGLKFLKIILQCSSLLIPAILLFGLEHVLFCCIETRTVLSTLVLKYFKVRWIIWTIPCRDYAASAEALKALASLDALSTDKNYTELRTTAEHAARLIRQPENSLHNAHQLVMDVARQLYTDSFLHAHRSTDRLEA